MVLEKLYLDNFLSYDTPQVVEFSSGLNVIVGNNAVGKTNLVESIYFATLGKANRSLKDKDLLNWDNGEKGARIKLLAKQKYTSHTVDIFLDKFAKKRIAIDGLPVSKLGELIGVINLVFFSPNEIKLIKESPQERRRFLDISLSQQNRMYFYTLVKYNKLLAQRNKILKTQSNSNNYDQILDIVTDKMVDCCVFIIEKRLEFISYLLPIANNIHQSLTDGKEELNLVYESDVVDYDNIKEDLSKAYKKALERDKKLQFTSVGIHRDDLKITAGGIEVRKFGSQGQQRTSALSLKLAELEIFYKEKKEYPILILDDVLGELDNNRQKALFKHINGIQTIVTCTEFDENLSQEYALYQVKNKNIKRI